GLCPASNVSDYSISREDPGKGCSDRRKHCNTYSWCSRRADTLLCYTYILRGEGRPNPAPTIGRPASPPAAEAQPTFYGNIGGSRDKAKRYIELKSGHNNNGPAWIARVKVFRRTVYKLLFSRSWNFDGSGSSSPSSSLRPDGPGERSPGLRPQADTLGQQARHGSRPEGPREPARRANRFRPPPPAALQARRGMGLPGPGESACGL